jgi:hypothetical protein
MLPLEPCLCALSPSIWIFFQVFTFASNKSLLLNHGNKSDSPYGYVSPYILCNMNNTLPLQYAYVVNAIAQPKHR